MKRLGIITKVLLIILAIQLSACVLGSSVVKADDTLQSSDVSIQSIIDAGNSWTQQGKKEAGNYGDEGYFIGELIGIGQILVVIGFATVLIVGTIMGIQWITATPDKKAKLQQQLIGLVIATVVIFGAVGIWQLVIKIMSNLENTL